MRIAILAAGRGATSPAAKTDWPSDATNFAARQREGKTAEKKKKTAEK